MIANAQKVTPEMKKKKTDGPDQKWSWVIAFSGFVIILIMSGVARIAGILYVELIMVYGVTREEATLPFALRGSLQCLIGPLVGLLGHRYGIRRVSVVGGVISTLGISLCCMVNNICWLSVLWGGVLGIGNGLSILLIQVTINQYFVKYRAFANGLALSGGCIASFLLPPVLVTSIEQYGLRGTFLVLGGITLHSVPAAMLLRPPSWLQENGNKEPMDNKSPKTPYWKKDNDQGLSTIHGIYNVSFEYEKTLTDGNIPKYKPGQEKLPIRSERNFDHQKICGTKSLKTNDKSGTLGEKMSSDCPKASQQFDYICEAGVSPRIPSDPFLKRFTGICLNVMFIQMGTSLAVYIYVFSAFFTVFIDYSIDKGIGEHLGQYVITAFSIGDLTGRLGLAWVMDKGLLSIKNFTAIGFLAMSATLVLFPYTNTFYSLTGLCVFLGLTGGAIVVMFPLQIARYISPAQQSIAMGSINLFSGLLSFSLAPIIGYYRDYVGSYDGMLHIIGAMCGLMSVCWFMEPVWVKLQNKKSMDEQQS